MMLTQVSHPFPVSHACLALYLFLLSYPSPLLRHFPLPEQFCVGTTCLQDQSILSCRKAHLHWYESIPWNLDCLCCKKVRENQESLGFAPDKHLQIVIEFKIVVYNLVPLHFWPDHFILRLSEVSHPPLACLQLIAQYDRNNPEQQLLTYVGRILIDANAKEIAIQCDTWVPRPVWIVRVFQYQHVLLYSHQWLCYLGMQGCTEEYSPLSFVPST